MSHPTPSFPRLPRHRVQRDGQLRQPHARQPQRQLQLHALAGHGPRRSPAARPGAAAPQRGHGQHDAGVLQEGWVGSSGRGRWWHCHCPRGVGGTELVEIGWVWGRRAPWSPCWALGDAQVSPGLNASPSALEMGMRWPVAWQQDCDMLGTGVLISPRSAGSAPAESSPLPPCAGSFCATSTGITASQGGSRKHAQGSPHLRTTSPRLSPAPKPPPGLCRSPENTPGAFPTSKKLPELSPSQPEPGPLRGLVPTVPFLSPPSKPPDGAAGAAPRALSRFREFFTLIIVCFCPCSLRKIQRYHIPAAGLGSCWEGAGWLLGGCWAGSGT